MSSTTRIDSDGFSNINEVSKIIKIEKYHKYSSILVDVENGIKNKVNKNLIKRYK